MGRGAGSFGRSCASCARCTGGGRVKPPEPLVKLLETWPPPGESSGSVGGDTRLTGAGLGMTAAPGQPHSYSCAGGTGSELGEVYAGR
jgi:hypothetical protein